MVVVSAVTPVNIPVVTLIVAVPGVAELHVPPLTLLLSVALLPMHRVVFPAIVVGSGLTVIVAVVMQPKGVVYSMATFAGVTPVIVPLLMSAVATAVFVLLHVPEGVVSLSIILLPWHTMAGPVIGVSGFTVTVVVAEQPAAVE